MEAVLINRILLNGSGIDEKNIAEMKAGFLGFPPPSFEDWLDNLRLGVGLDQQDGCVRLGGLELLEL